jgi:predicted aldo/keto reductase-like oxidoreductase
MQTVCVVFVHYCHHCLPCTVEIEIGWVIWHLDQVASRGVEQVREWYAEFPVNVSACTACGVCLERCPFYIDIVAKMSKAAELLKDAAASARDRCL